MGDVSQHFSREELQCPCCETYNLADGFLDWIELIRSLYGKPMLINSCCRCQSKNMVAGGRPQSSHLLPNTQAIDVHCLDSPDRYALVAAAIKAGAQGIGIYRTFIHIDDMTRPVPCLWVDK